MLLKISSLAELHKDLTGVTKLEFTHVKIGPEDIKSLFIILSDNSQITSIHLGFNSIDADGAKAIAAALDDNNTLTSINLKSNEIDEDGAKAIAAALETNKTLTSIHLGYNQICANGAKAIATALETNKTLTSINLGYNQICANGAKAIATALETNKTLTSIHLHCNSIGGDGSKAVATALKTNETLTFINLTYNEIGVDGAKAIAAALKTNKTLISLDLDYYQIGGSDSDNAIASALDRNKDRKDLVEEFTQKDIMHISVQSISDELLERLKAAIPILRELKEKGVGSEVLSEVIKSDNFELCSNATSAIITNVIKYFMEHVVYDNAIILAIEYEALIDYAELFKALTLLPRPDTEEKDDYDALCQIILGNLDDFARNESYLEAVEMPLVRDLAMHIKDKLAGTTLSEEYKALVTKVMTSSL